MFSQAAMVAAFTSGEMESGSNGSDADRSLDAGSSLSIPWVSDLSAFPISQFWMIWAWLEFSSGTRNRGLVVSELDLWSGARSKNVGASGAVACGAGATSGAFVVRSGM